LILQSAGNITREGVQRFIVLITDLDELKQRLRTEWAKLDIISSLRQPFVSGVVDRSRSVMRVLYNFFRNIVIN